MDTREVQSLNADAPIVMSVHSNTTDSSWPQFANADDPTDVTLDGIVREIMAVR